MAAPPLVITGAAGLLAAHLSAARLAAGEPVGFLAAPGAFARFEALVAEVMGAAERGAALVRLGSPADLAGAAVWHFAPGHGSPSAEWLARLRHIGIGSLDLVETPFSGGERWRWLLDPEPSGAPPPADPHAAGLGQIRRFTTAPLLGAAPDGDIAQEGILHFLATLFDLKTELEERVADYFEYRALRAPIDPDAPINIVPVEGAARAIASIAAAGETGDFLIAGTASLPGEEFLEIVGDVYGVGLLGGGRATAIDALFERRLRGFAATLIDREPAAAAKAWKIAGMSPETLKVGAAELESMLEEVRRRQCAAGAAAAAEGAAAAGLAVYGGQDLAYCRSGGEGPLVAFVNAYGQGSEAWSRLAGALSPRFRVVGWELRGLDDGSPPLTVEDHVADLATMIEAEGGGPAHLVAWCTGPKIAIEFAARFPERVASLVLLNTTLKCTATPAELDTPYEQGFQSLCRVLDAQPATAPAIIQSLTASSAVAEADLLEQGDEPAAEVLAAMNRDLRQPVLQPFRNSACLLRYAGQLADFWSRDVAARAGELRVPVLLLSSELDRVASPESSAWAARLFADARILSAAGATHYFLYDRADVVARAIEWFVSGARPDPARDPARAVEP